MQDFPRTDGLSGFLDVIVSYEKVQDSQKIVDKETRITPSSEM